MTLALYGHLFRNRPVWYIRLRGLYWLASGLCPCCYSSPPLPECPICTGNRDYGPLLSGYHRDLWKNAWEARCRTW